MNLCVYLIEKGNFTFVNKLNKFVDTHFEGCYNSIVKNINILRPYLNCLKNINFDDINYCIICNNSSILLKSKCNHKMCIKCTKMKTKCSFCKIVVKKN